ncbi:MAG: hypothetical protein QXR73_01640 [Candidatus Micrarchaeaceae archaeon]
MATGIPALPDFSKLLQEGFLAPVISTFVVSRVKTEALDSLEIDRLKGEIKHLFNLFNKRKKIYFSDLVENLNAESTKIKKAVDILVKEGFLK